MTIDNMIFTMVYSTFNSANSTANTDGNARIIEVRIRRALNILVWQAVQHGSLEREKLINLNKIKEDL